MKIRRLNQSEHDSTRSLYEEVFPEDSRAFVSYYYAEKTRDNIIYVAEEDGAIQSMLHLNPYTVLINNERTTSHYIVAVATRKAYRSRGYMRALLQRALVEMYEQGECFTFLMPAAEKIYLPYDFRTVYEQDRTYYHEEEELLKGTTVSPLTPSECEMLADAANAQLTQHYQVFALRDGAYYQRLIKEYGADGATLMLYKKGTAITDCRVRLPRKEEAPGKIMVRPVDVKHLLQKVQVREPIRVSVSIRDSLLPGNNARVVLEGERKVEVKEWTTEAETMKEEIPTISIAALTELLFGAITPEELKEEEGNTLREEQIAELKKIIPLSRIFLNEIV